MKKMDMNQKIPNKVKEILQRYQRYTDHLSVPSEWGERALRGWLVCELFHEILEWPFECIVMGEQFDVLFVDHDIRPKLYLETKKLGRGLADIERFNERIRLYGTLRYAIITDGSIWARYEISSGKPMNQIDVDTKMSQKEWSDFFAPLHAKSFLYEVM